MSEMATEDKILKALNNSVIFSNILNYLGHEDLKSIRLVHPQWLALSKSYFNSRSRVDLSISEVDEDGTDIPLPTLMSKLVRLEEYLADYSKYQYNHKHFVYSPNPDVPEDIKPHYSENIKRLLTLYGEGCSSLDLFWSNLNRFRSHQYLDEILTLTPNLVELDLCLSIFNGNKFSFYWFTDDTPVLLSVKRLSLALVDNDGAIPDPELEELCQRNTE